MSVSRQLVISPYPVVCEDACPVVWEDPCPVLELEAAEDDGVEMDEGLVAANSVAALSNSIDWNYGVSNEASPLTSEYIIAAHIFHVLGCANR